MASTAKKKFRNIAIISVSVLLTATALVSLGFLSFVGFFLIYPSVVLALLSLALASIVEFTVIFENIRNAFLKLVKKSFLKSRLATNYLNDLVLKTKIKSQFLTKYFEHALFVERHHHRRITDKKEKKKLKKKEKNLKFIQKSFRHYLFNTGLVSDELRAELDQLVPKNKRAQIAKEEKRKRIAGRVIILPVLIAAVSCGVVTYSAIMGALAEILPLLHAATSAFAVSLSALAPFMIGLSVVAGVAYAFQMYNTALNIIYDDSMQKLWRKVVDNVKKGGVKSILYGLGVLCLIGLGIFVTCATAGTWWGAIQPAIAVLSAGQKAVTAMAIISIFFFGLANLAFNLQNTGETLTNIESFSIKNTIKAVIAKIKMRFAFENKWQRFNPFRAFLFVTNVPFKIGGFVLHLVAIGATTDNFGNPIVSCIAAGTTEGFEDITYIPILTTHGHDGPLPDEHAKQKAQEGKNKAQHGHKHKHEHSHSHAHAHSLGGGHDHTHVDIFGALFVLITFIPFYLPAIIWDWAFSQRNDGQPFKKLTFKEAFLKAFGKLPEHIDSNRPKLGAQLKREREYVMRMQSSKKFAKSAVHAKTTAVLTQNENRMVTPEASVLHHGNRAQAITV